MFWSKKEKKTETAAVRDELLYCSSVDEVKEKVFPLLRTQQEEWAAKIREILEKGKFSKKEFALLCDTSRPTLDSWCRGTLPKKRETFLRIGLAAGYDREQMNRLLQRYGRFPALYSKSLEDCICIYVLRENTAQNRVRRFLEILNRIKERLLVPDRQEEADVITTRRFDTQLEKVGGEAELERFISENAAIFAGAYHRLYAYVEMFIRVNYLEPARVESVFEIAEIQGWSSSLRHTVSAIRQRKWYPLRDKIISLGFHLSMDHEQVDQMLELAYMEPLCPKNPFESIIIFILEEASLENMLEVGSEYFDPDALCGFAREILSELDLPEVESFLTELPEAEDEREQE